MQLATAEVPNSAALNARIHSFNRSLSYTPAQNTGLLGRAVKKLAGDEIPLSQINQVIQDNRHLIYQNAQNPTLQRELLQLRTLATQVYNVDSPEKTAFLQSLNGIIKTHFSSDKKLTPEEQLLNDIEQGLPKDCFMPFRRDKNGKLVKPKTQLEDFINLLKSNQRGVPKLVTAADYIRLAKERVEQDFMACFRWYYEHQEQGPSIIGASVEVGNAAIRKFAKENLQAFQEMFQPLEQGLPVTLVIPPEVGLLKRLNTLKLTEANQVKMLPPSIANLTNLRVVNLRLAYIEKAPEVLYQLPNLRELAVCGFVPDCSRLPPQLETLDIQRFTHDEHSLNTFPPAIFGLEKLTILVLGDTAIEKIPSEIKSLAYLEILTIAIGSPSEDLRAVTSLPKLKQLWCGGGKLERLSPEIKKLSNLESLNLHHNNFSELPDEIGELKKLKTLSIDGNSDIVSPLPETLGNLTSLKTIICDWGHLQLLPASLIDCPQLKKIFTASHIIWKKTPNGKPLEAFLKEHKKKTSKLT